MFNDTPMEEGSGVFFLTAHFVIPVISLLWRKVLECSSSHCSLRHPCVLTHSYGGRFWSVLPHTAHFVIPVISLLWRKVLECSSSHCSLRHPCVLTPMTCLLTHLIVIPDFSLESSHPSHPWLLTPITCATMLTHPRVLSHLTSLSAHTHHLSSHTHHLTSSVTTRTLTSFSLVSPH